MRKPGDTGSSTEEKSRVVDHASSSSNWNETAEYRSDLWSSSWSGWLELHVLHIIPQFYEWSNVSYQTFEWGDSTFVQALISSTNSCTIIWVCFVSVLFFLWKFVTNGQRQHDIAHTHSHTTTQPFSQLQQDTPPPVKRRRVAMKKAVVVITPIAPLRWSTRLKSALLS